MAKERVQRRLAAILAADVAGYSWLMGEDEEGMGPHIYMAWDAVGMRSSSPEDG